MVVRSTFIYICTLRLRSFWIFLLFWTIEMTSRTMFEYHKHFMAGLGTCEAWVKLIVKIWKINYFPKTQYFIFWGNNSNKFWQLHHYKHHFMLIMIEWSSSRSTSLQWSNQWLLINIAEDTNWISQRPNLIFKLKIINRKYKINLLWNSWKTLSNKFIAQDK